MSDVTAQTLERVFKMGSLELPDPDPSAEATAALRLYSASYPVLGSATLAEPTVDGDRLVFEIVKPQGKTKG